MEGDKQVSDESLYNKRKDGIVGMRSFIDKYKQTKEKRTLYSYICKWKANFMEE